MPTRTRRGAPGQVEYGVTGAGGIRASDSEGRPPRMGGSRSQHCCAGLLVLSWPRPSLARHGCDRRNGGRSRSESQP